MSNVVGLRGEIPLYTPVPEVIECLEELLARAKAGEVRAVALAYVLPEGITGTAWNSGAASRHELTSAIAQLEFRHMAQVMEIIE